MKTYNIVVLVIIIGIVSGAFASFITLNLYGSSKESLMRDFYLTENLIHVSPHSLRKAMDKGSSSFILVDLRSKEEYEKEHIIGAINIPAYKYPNTSAYDEVDRIVGAFSALPKNKEIIVYCYSIPCMTGRKIGKMLAENGIYVKQLGIGWNEWKYYWTLWNHEFEWNQTNVEDYVVSGPEPRISKIKNISGACALGGLGC